MAPRQPAFAVRGPTTSPIPVDAETVRRAVSNLTPNGQGVKNGNYPNLGDFAVIPDTPNDKGVTVQPGEAWVDGTINAYQGSYYCLNDAPYQRNIQNPDATNPRNDIVGIVVPDSQYAGTVDNWDVVIITGTPAQVPADPVLPANFLKLARIVVRAQAASVVATDIADLRVHLTQILGRQLIVGTTGSYGGPAPATIHAGGTPRTGPLIVPPSGRVRVKVNAKVTPTGVSGNIGDCYIGVGWSTASNQGGVFNGPTQELDATVIDPQNGYGPYALNGNEILYGLTVGQALYFYALWWIGTGSNTGVAIANRAASWHGTWIEVESVV